MWSTAESAQGVSGRTNARERGPRPRPPARSYCGDEDAHRPHHRGGITRGGARRLDPPAARMCDRRSLTAHALWGKSTAADNAPASPLWVREQSSGCQIVGCARVLRMPLGAVLVAVAILLIYPTDGV